MNANNPLELWVDRKEDLSEIKLLHAFEVVGTIPTGQRHLELKPSQVGYGPVKLHAGQTIANGQSVRSSPQVILVEP